MREKKRHSYTLASVESAGQTAETSCLWRVMGHWMPEDKGGSGFREKDEVISETTRHTPLEILPQTRLKWSYSTQVWQGYPSSAQRQTKNNWAKCEIFWKKVFFPCWKIPQMGNHEMCVIIIDNIYVAYIWQYSIWYNTTL